MNHGEILNQISASRREALAADRTEEVVPAPVDTAEGEEEVVRRDPPKRKKATHSEAPVTEENDAQQ